MLDKWQLLLALGMVVSVIIYAVTVVTIIKPSFLSSEDLSF